MVERKGIVVIKSEVIPKYIETEHKTAEFKLARRNFKCDECGLIIPEEAGHYFVVSINSQKDIGFPEHVHIHCIEKNLGV